MSWADANLSEDPPPPFFGELEDQLAHAVTISLAGALEAFKQSLNETITEAVHELTEKLAAAVAAQSTSASQWAGPDYDEITASIQHSVLMALAQYEPPTSAAVATGDPFDSPATARDVARVNQRIDELRSLLLG